MVLATIQFIGHGHKILRLMDRLARTYAMASKESRPDNFPVHSGYRENKRDVMHRDAKRKFFLIQTTHP
ncbi:hypothetical protein J6590_066076 [Homalodisca vitripennis]|nr:hypothetical protein J6590_066076 [Homalodisca vitripennis]